MGTAGSVPAPQGVCRHLGAALCTGVCAGMVLSVPGEPDTSLWSHKLRLDLRHFQPNFCLLQSNSETLPAMVRLKKRL